MKAQIYINRHIMASNNKNKTDKPAISINTYKGTFYAKSVQLPQGTRLIQDRENARCSGATIWIEVDNFDDLIWE